MVIAIEGKLKVVPILPKIVLFLKPSLRITSSREFEYKIVVLLKKVLDLPSQELFLL
jgi:hypothetical protein